MDEVKNATSPDLSGLKWVRTLWGLEPRWTVDPDMTTVMETAKSTLGIQGPCSIEFLVEGAFNKLYVVKFADEEVIVRVTLPVEPKWKTLSEVATLRWVRQNTNLPVPDALSYTADRANPIGFEWIIMNKVPGEPWADVWKEFPLSVKAQLVRRVASFFSDTFTHQLRGIGNIFPDMTPDMTPDQDHLDKEGKSTGFPGFSVATEPSDQRSSATNGPSGGDNDLPAGAKVSSSPSFTVQRLVSSAFIGKDLCSKVSCGPFASSREWISARLDLAELDCSRRLRNLRKSEQAEDETIEDNTHSQAPTNQDNAQDVTDEEEEDDDSAEEDDDEETLENIMSIITRLRGHLMDVFHVKGAEPEPSIIFHDDMNRHNILVDKTGNLTAVVDWECVSALPLYMACQYPPFLQGKPNDLEPIKSKYQHDENGEVAELFWEHLEAYELTQLRRLFLAEMEELQPDWVAIFKSSQLKRDFDLAVTSCDDPFMIRRIMRWLDDWDSGVEGMQGLEERMDNASM